MGGLGRSSPRLRATVETLAVVLDGDDVRRAEDAEPQCAAVGNGGSGQWSRRGAFSTSPLMPRYVHRRYGELISAPIRPMPRLGARTVSCRPVRTLLVASSRPMSGAQRLNDSSMDCRAP